MPAHRRQREGVTWIVKDAQLGAIGLDWAKVPTDVATSADASCEWQRLAVEYADSPTRFREADRAALAMYCVAFAIVRQAAGALLADGVLVAGRSRSDKSRNVKSPAMAVWTAASGQLRFWIRELGLSPDARARQGLVNDGKKGDDDEERRIFGDDLLD